MSERLDKLLTKCIMVAAVWTQAASEKHGERPQEDPKSPPVKEEKWVHAEFIKKTSVRRSRNEDNI